MKKRSRSIWTRILVILPVVFFLLFSFIHPASAAVFSDTGTVKAGEVIDDDYFTSAERVTIDGTINGFLFASGNEIQISGTINGDAALMGNTIILTETAKINGNLFTGGAVVTVRGQVSGSIFGGSSSLVMYEKSSAGRNLYYGGYNLETRSGSKIARSLYAGVYQSILGGEVDQDVSISAGAIELRGIINRNATLEVSQPGEGILMPFLPPGSPSSIRTGLRIAPEAQIGGKLTYTSPVDQGPTIQTKPEGGIAFQTPIPEPTQIPEKTPAPPQESTQLVFALGKTILTAFREFVTLLLLGGLVLWLLPSLFRKTLENARMRPAASAGYGFITIIVGYVGGIFAVIVVVLLGLLFHSITLNGLSSVIFSAGLSSITLVMILFTFLIVYLSKLIVIYLVGDWIIQYFNPKTRYTSILNLVVGCLLFVILAAVPYLGWLLNLLVTLIGIGAIWILIRKYYKSMKNKSAEVDVPSPNTAA